MAVVAEQTLINQLATEFGGIDGIKNSYGFAQNPDSLNPAQLPAAIFFPRAFRSRQRGHHNVHINELDISCALFVVERESMGGRLKFIENKVMPYLYKVRSHFQSESVITNLLGLGLTQATLVTGNYTAGGPFLTYAGIEYVGVVFQWTFIEIN